MIEVAEDRELYSWEVRALKTAHRKVPLFPVGPGHCRWCERPIIGKKGKHIGRPDPRRSWCRPGDRPERPDCYYDFLLHSDAAAQFRYLEFSRGLVCASCGIENPQRWRNVGECTFGNLPPTPWEGERNGAAYIEAVIEHRRACLAEFPAWNKGNLVELVSALEVDHVVPLWKVALKPIELRRPYFGPDFLQLLCDRCHKAKTAAEAADRAAVRALARASDAQP